MAHLLTDTNHISTNLKSYGGYSLPITYAGMAYVVMVYIVMACMVLAYILTPA